MSESGRSSLGHPSPVARAQRDRVPGQTSRRSAPQQIHRRLGGPARRSRPALGRIVTSPQSSRHAQVSAHRRLRQTEVGDQVDHAVFTQAQMLHDRQPGGVAGTRGTGMPRLPRLPALHQGTHRAFALSSPQDDIASGGGPARAARPAPPWTGSLPAGLGRPHLPSGHHRRRRLRVRGRLDAERFLSH